MSWKKHLIKFYIVLIIAAAILTFNRTTNHLSEVFYTSIGLLTFTSIFYAFTISKGAEIVENVRNVYEAKKKELRENRLKKVVDSKGSTVFEEIEKIRGQHDDLDSALGFLDLNKWLFWGVICYIVSIATYITRGEDALSVFIQLAGFWVGFLSTLVLVTVWYVVITEHITQIKREEYGNV